MIRRMLQFVLTLAVLATAPVAQAFAMPCCQVTTAHTAAMPPAARSDDAMEHCHSAMLHVTASAHSMAPCATSACASQTDVAIAPIDETVLLPPAAIAADCLARLSNGHFNAQPFSSNTPSHPPDTHRQSLVPLRV